MAVAGPKHSAATAGRASSTLLLLLLSPRVPPCSFSCFSAPHVNSPSGPAYTQLHFFPLSSCSSSPFAAPHKYCQLTSHRDFNLIILTSSCNKKCINGLLHPGNLILLRQNVKIKSHFQLFRWEYLLGFLNNEVSNPKTFIVWNSWSSTTGSLIDHDKLPLILYIYTVCDFISAGLHD